MFRLPFSSPSEAQQIRAYGQRVLTLTFQFGDSKYLLPGFARCGRCNGGLHVRSGAHGSHWAFFYACTSHYNRGPEVCPHVSLWPMEAIDAAVLTKIASEVLAPTLVDQIVASARRQFETSQRPDRAVALRKELDAVNREVARLTESVATGGGAIPSWSSDCARQRPSDVRSWKNPRQIDSLADGSRGPRSSAGCDTTSRPGGRGSPLRSLMRDRAFANC